MRDLIKPTVTVPRSTLRPVEILLDSRHGVYIPQLYAEQYAPKFSGAYPEYLKVLLDGPEHERYWEAWENVLNRDTLTVYTEDPDGTEHSYTYTLHHDGDLFLVCDDLMNDEEYENVFGEPRED